MDREADNKHIREIINLYSSSNILQTLRRTAFMTINLYVLN